MGMYAFGIYEEISYIPRCSFHGGHRALGCIYFHNRES